LSVAVIGTTLSAYIYSWQSNEELEEKIAAGQLSLASRRGASKAALSQTRRDIWIGMIFSNVVMYFIILSTAATLHRAGLIPSLFGQNPKPSKKAGGNVPFPPDPPSRLSLHQNLVLNE
jgi:hypothetical protein